MNVNGGFEAIGQDASQLSEFFGNELILEVTVKEDEVYGSSNAIKKWIRK